MSWTNSKCDVFNCNWFLFTTALIYFSHSFYNNRRTCKKIGVHSELPFSCDIYVSGYRLVSKWSLTLDEFHEFSAFSQFFNNQKNNCVCEDLPTKRYKSRKYAGKDKNWCILWFTQQIPLEIVHEIYVSDVYNGLSVAIGREYSKYPSNSLKSIA